MFYANVAPLLLHLKNCFTALLFFEAIDFGPTVYPVAIFKSGHAYYDPPACNLTTQEAMELELSLHRSNIRICSYVLHNYNIKGTRCVGVVSVFPPSDFGEYDIYRYLNHYWSRSEPQTFRYLGYNYESKKFIVPLHPPRIRLQILIADTATTLRSRYLKSDRIMSLRRNMYPHWDNYLRLPLVAACIPPEDTAESNLHGEIAVIFYGLVSVIMTGIKFNSTSAGINSKILIRWIDDIQKNSLKIDIIGEYDSMAQSTNIKKFGDIALKIIYDIFNESRILRKTKGSSHTTSLRALHIRQDQIVKYEYENDKQFLLFDKERKVLITCSGLAQVSNFSHLVRPYDGASWTCLLVLISLICSLPMILFKFRETAIIYPEALLSILLEHSYHIQARVTWGAFVIAIGPFVLMGIVLSNGYKGIITTSSIKPFMRAGLNSLEIALERNYKGIVTPAMPHLSQYCCKNKEGLALQLDPARLKLAGSFPPKMACGDIVTFRQKIQLLDHIDSPSTRNVFQFELEGSGNLLNMTLTKNGTLKEKLLLKLLQNMQPVDCAHETVTDELLSCNNTFLIGTKKEARMIGNVQKFYHSRKSLDPIYSIQNTSNAFHGYMTGYYIYPLSLARRTLSIVISAFQESGLTKHHLAMISWNHDCLYLRQLRREFGKLVDQTSTFLAMSLDTHISYTFQLYLYGMLFSLCCFGIEFTYLYYIFIYYYIGICWQRLNCK